MMSLSAILSELHLEYAAELLASSWAETQACFPDEPPDFLKPEVFLPCRQYAMFPEELDAALVAIAEAILSNEALTRLAWHLQQLLYMHPDYPGGQVCRWPSLEHLLGPDHRLFYVLLALSATPLTQRWHTAHEIPDDITRDTVRQHRELNKLHWNETQRRWDGSSMSLYWTRHHVFARLFALGRLEYMVQPFNGPVQVYRHRASRRVVALALDGCRFSAEGYLDEPADSPTLADGFTSRLKITDETVTGHFVSPLGRATGEILTLPLAEWELVLAPDDPILETHIPFGDSMTPERCRDSMRQALEFFPRFFPERRFVGFACTSWVLNPELIEIIGPHSNMVLWQNELYLFPYPSGPHAGLAAVFGDREPDLATAPRDTTLRRAILDRLESGKRLRLGGMFLLPEELERYGEQPYRNQ